MSLKEIKNIGIVGGGQLGQMSAAAAQRLGFKVVVFSDIADCPAALVADEVFVAPYLDEKALAKFASKVDVITYEFENIPYQTTEFLNNLVKTCPNPQVLKIAQNRILEKNFVNDAGIKTAEFKEIKNLADLKSGILEFKKAILKTATMGYDGKGQYVLEENSDLESVWNENVNKPLILEKFCPFELEISAIIARKENGEICAFEPLKNIHKNGILDESHYPALISAEISSNAKEAATKLAEALDLVGLLTVEFFVLKNGELLVNEIAPRPHNSGHFSMDAAKTSQFEQLIRAICNLEFGDPDYIREGYMKNLIGEDVNDIARYENDDNSIIHLYGKKEVKQGRKMGHVNILKS